MTIALEIKIFIIEEVMNISYTNRISLKPYK